MPNSLKQLGWGTDLQAFASPVAAQEREAARALAFGAFLAACSSRPLELVVQAVFHQPEAPLPGAAGALVRLWSLLERLIAVELPSLSRRVRVEMSQGSEWMRAPHGGRVDAATTLRVSGGALPEAWLVRRAERRLDTPVNVFAAAVLRWTVERIDHVVGLYRRRRLVVPETVGRASVGLQRFLRDHFLGRIAVAPGTTPEAYRAAAARRATEIQRIRSLVAWWDALQEVEFTALQAAFKGRDAMADVDVHASYEMAVALALVAALGLRWRCVVDPGSVRLQFIGRDGRGVVQLGAEDPTGLEGRGLTARLDLVDAGGDASTWLIEARYAHARVMKPYLGHLTMACRTIGDGCRGLLVTPGPVGVVPVGFPVRWVEMDLAADLPALMGMWSALLAEMPGCRQKGEQL